MWKPVFRNTEIVLIVLMDIYRVQLICQAQSRFAVRSRLYNWVETDKLAVIQSHTSLGFLMPDSRDMLAGIFRSAFGSIVRSRYQYSGRRWRCVVSIRFGKQQSDCFFACVAHIQRCRWAAPFHWRTGLAGGWCLWRSWMFGESASLIVQIRKINLREQCRDWYIRQKSPRVGKAQEAMLLWVKFFAL